MTSDNPAALTEHDPHWAQTAAQCLHDLSVALIGLRGADSAFLDHIGSTSVPELAAKPIIDVQLRILPLPSYADLGVRLSPLGYEQALGSRPDSPGVRSDIPFGDESAPTEVREKRLYVAHNPSVVLHVRRADSPWGRYTVWFRDWLIAHPGERERYENTKRRLSSDNAGKTDYDDYTRAKSVYFREVHPAFCAWADRRAATEIGM
ncbi:MAG: hypothetical protein JWR52_3011 [Marmoricola sp.]|nr:hypothetical protein [Marmoricola sp.]